MRDFLRSVLEQNRTLTVGNLLLNITASVIFGLLIYVSYWYTHTGTTYSKKFNVTLLSLSVLTASVMTVIGNNVALSLGMVGALSIVRFRTAIKDARDTTYIFWTIVVGISCGAGDFLVAGIGSAAVFAVLLLLGRVRNENRMLLIVRGAGGKEMEIEGLVFKLYQAKALMRVKNTTPEAVEMIFELDRNTYDAAQKRQGNIIQSLYALGGIEYVNIVAQSDEITG
ncbi:MAG TPA: DUF4956 domain-containing protein [Candidatus Limnocylindria bacterium]|nr:DUF4956 domain-containing protein [Candidatus Limnocylindria bacterium]